MRSGVLFLAFSASVNAILLVEGEGEHGRGAEDLVGPRSGFVLGDDEVRFLDGPAVNEQSVDGGSLAVVVELVTTQILEKRRGGGRGGGGGGRSSVGGSTGAGGSRSTAGGRTKTGSGTPKGHGGYYGGGAAVPFTSGKPSTSGMVPVILSSSIVSAVFVGAWLYSSVYAYHFDHDINYYNATNHRNATLPVTCLCQEYSVCGCDENHDQTYVDSLVANATNTVDGRSKIAEVNGTRTLLINGTLDNGTTADGGTEAVSGATALVGQSVGSFTIAAMIVVGALYLG